MRVGLLVFAALAHLALAQSPPTFVPEKPRFFPILVGHKNDIVAPSEAIVEKLKSIPVHKMKYTEDKFQCADFAYQYRHICGVQGIECRQVTLGGVKQSKEIGHMANLVFEPTAEKDLYHIHWVEPQTNKIVVSWKWKKNHYQTISEDAAKKVYAHYEEWGLKHVVIGETFDRCAFEPSTTRQRKDPVFLSFDDIRKQYVERTGYDPVRHVPIERKPTPPPPDHDR